MKRLNPPPVKRDWDTEDKGLVLCIHSIELDEQGNFVLYTDEGAYFISPDLWLLWEWAGFASSMDDTAFPCHVEFGQFEDGQLYAEFLN